MAEFSMENRLFTAGVVLLLGLYLFGVVGSQLVSARGANMGAVPLARPPSAQFLLGTEGQGRDMFTVMVISIPNTFKIGFVAGTVGVAIGTLIGLLAGYYRGWADTFFSSFADVMLVIPTLAILITVSAYVRVVTVEIMAVIVGLLAWPLPARVIRAQTLSLRERLFVQVAKLSGQNDFEIIVLQILPNLTAYLAATFVGAVSAGILASVGLEILGLGPQNVPTIGRTLYNSFRYTALFRGMWWWWGPPVVTLAVIFTGLFFMSISLDKYANPRLKGARGS
jgi:peptide/nickel transport system permease protein